MKKLFDDKVLIEAEVVNNTTKAGIILDGESLGDYITAKVLRIGDKVQKVVEGDIILYRKDAPVDLGKKYGTMISEFNIIATL
jgi:co-chaperonin GroES (HSP10)